MKTLQFAAAALTLAALSATPTLAQPADTTTPAGGASQPGTAGTTAGGTMQGGTINPMAGMSPQEQYRARWVWYNLDERQMRRYTAAGFDEATIRGAANIALRTGLDLGYVLRRIQTSGLPLAQAAVMFGVPATSVGEDIPGMGSNVMVMGGSMGGTMQGGNQGNTTPQDTTGTNTGNTGGAGVNNSGTVQQGTSGNNTPPANP